MSIDATIFLLAPIAIAVISAALIERLGAPVEQQKSDRKERSPKRENHEGLVDESNAVSRAVERSKERQTPASLAEPAVAPGLLTALAAQETAAERYARTAPTEFARDFSQLVDSQEHTILS